MKKYLQFSCFIGVYLAVLAYGADHIALDDEKAFQKAADLLNQGMYLEAIGAYREIADYSENKNMKARALLFIGTTYSLYLNYSDDAIGIFNYVLETYPDCQAASDALFNRGMVHYEKKDFKAAYNAFTKYLDLYPNGMRRQSVDVWAESALEQMGAPELQKQMPERPVIKDAMIRVLLLKDSESATLGADSRIKIAGLVSGKTVYEGTRPVMITGNNKTFAINRIPVSEPSLTIVSEGVAVSLGNVRYRGELVISADEKGITVVNHVPLEEYLYGVVPREMPDAWEIQALMAQAIAARTYVLYIKEKTADKPFDVEATTSSQVYGGYDAERKKTNLAVNATRGQVVSYQGQLIVAYFHSNSGGHTEDASNVWGAELPYLKGVPDEFSKNAPDGSWECFLPYEDVEKSLIQSGLNVGAIKKMNPEKKSQSGRTTELTLASDKGTSKITGNNFRIRVGAEKLKSTLFDAEPKRNGVLFKGKGYGHGVGLSQCGAQKMARSGYTCMDILKHYYKNVSIVSIEND